ncbi:MAG: hypothetical protein GY716_08730 [bacterium]|nr:hypothetical protein [bacterium]
MRRAFEILCAAAVLALIGVGGCDSAGSNPVLGGDPPLTLEIGQFVRSVSLAGTTAVKLPGTLPVIVDGGPAVQVDPRGAAVYGGELDVVVRSTEPVARIRIGMADVPGFYELSPTSTRGTQSLVVRVAFVAEPPVGEFEMLYVGLDGSGRSGSPSTQQVTLTDPPPGCGDGTVDEGETCDAGPANSDVTPDACRTDCTQPRCGDGVTDTGESCDDANADDTDDCRNDCSPPSCGDGVTDPGEACDDGNDENEDACRNNCTRPSCGDAIVDPGEACDDGASNSDTAPDACRRDCTEARCGDGVVDGAESCEPAAGAASCCAEDCRFEAVGTGCDDGAFCTEDDACDVSGACSGQARSCDDGEVCTDDVCDEALDTCVSQLDPDNAPQCDDICGGDDGLACPGPNQFCRRPPGQCDEDPEGLCTQIPQDCPGTFEPVCGCNGVTYANACLAEAEAATIDFAGSCECEVELIGGTATQCSTGVMEVAFSIDTTSALGAFAFSVQENPFDLLQPADPTCEALVPGFSCGVTGASGALRRVSVFTESGAEIPPGTRELIRLRYVTNAFSPEAVTLPVLINSFDVQVSSPAAPCSTSSSPATLNVRLGPWPECTPP